MIEPIEGSDDSTTSTHKAGGEETFSHFPELVLKRINEGSFWVFLDSEGNRVAQFEKSNEEEIKNMDAFMEGKAIVYD